MGLAKSSAAWWNLPPWVAFSKTENEERGPGGGQMGRAELELAPLSQGQVLSLGSPLLGTDSCELCGGAGQARTGLA